MEFPRVMPATTPLGVDRDRICLFLDGFDLGWKIRKMHFVMKKGGTDCPASHAPVWTGNGSFDDFKLSIKYNMYTNRWVEWIWVSSCRTNRRAAGFNKFQVSNNCIDIIQGDDIVSNKIPQRKLPNKIITDPGKNINIGLKPYQYSTLMTSTADLSHTQAEQCCSR